VGAGSYDGRVEQVRADLLVWPVEVFDVVVVDLAGEFDLERAAWA
jgi:hypothetical protein